VKTLVALDIDGVLRPWDDEAYQTRWKGKGLYDRYGKLTGFKDWERVEEPYFTHVSQEQLALIQQVGDVYWLTTWLKQGIVRDFERITRLPKLPYIRPEQTLEAEYLYPWWKVGHFYVWARENHELVASYDRILWVDDDHEMHGYDQTGVDEIQEFLGRLGTELILHAPEPVWKKEEIEQWLASPE
jgi:hypothetical protein